MSDVPSAFGKVTVSGSFDDDKIIIDTDFGFDTAMRQVMDLQEQAVREALIKLGWTPPPDKGQP